MIPVHQTVDHLFRHESGKLVSVLSKLLGLQHLETAHDIVQDTLLQALHTWTYHGLPENPSAWLTRVAKNRAIDYLRRGKNFQRNISPQYSYLLRSEYILGPSVNEMFEEHSIQDSQLRMIFACCHPSIPPESQVALALKTLCGLSAAEIARAFLSTEDTISKRIYRAKEKIRQEAIELDLPSDKQLPSRLDAVLKCLYLLFNEGYNSSHPDQLIREDLCEEAMRLCYLLTCQPITNLPRTRALLALCCFQASRLQARLDDRGQIILLMHQDRSRWFRPLMEKGWKYLNEALSDDFETSPYHLEAAIAALHAFSPGFEQTNWKRIHFLYDQLYRIQPTPVVAMNRSIALAYAGDPFTALEDMLKIEGLGRYYLFPAAIGALQLECGRADEAIKYYERALALTQSRQEQQLLHEKIKIARERKMQDG